MAYDRYDNRYGNDDRWRDRERSYRDEDRGSRRGEWGRDDDRSSWNRGWDRGSGGSSDDRGFFERAGDEVRSWFGDEEAERRRNQDQREYERERSQREPGYRRDFSRDSSWDRGPTQTRSWDNDNRYGRDRSRGNDRYDRFTSSGDGGGQGQDVWGGSGFGGDYDRGRRFDRVDAGSTGTHGAHPMSAATGGGFGSGYGFGQGDYSNSQSSARDRAILNQSRGGDVHDHHYNAWRNRQIDELDRDYDDYRREHQSRFEQEFGGWREKRRGQRESMRRVTEHMDVVGSDGEHIGTVDKVRGDRIILTKSDENAGGHHHSIPCGWIDKVEDKVVINKSAKDAMKAWHDEDTSRALFERDDQGSEGPHALDRSFSGTY